MKGDILPKKRDNKVIQLYIPSDLKEWLREYADRFDLSMTTTIKLLLQRERAHDEGHSDGATLCPTVGITVE